MKSLRERAGLDRKQSGAGGNGTEKAARADLYLKLGPLNHTMRTFVLHVHAHSYMFMHTHTHAPDVLHAGNDR